MKTPSSPPHRPKSPPPDFVQDLATNLDLNFFLAVGLEENPYLPTLSYSDFANLFRTGKLSWDSVTHAVMEKYNKLAEGRIRQEGHFSEIYYYFNKKLEFRSKS